MNHHTNEENKLIIGLFHWMHHSYFHQNAEQPNNVCYREILQDPILVVDRCVWELCENCHREREREIVNSSIRFGREDISKKD